MMLPEEARDDSPRNLKSGDALAVIRPDSDELRGFVLMTVSSDEFVADTSQSLKEGMGTAAIMAFLIAIGIGIEENDGIRTAIPLSIAISTVPVSQI